jgi:hypothetical protein
MTSQKIEILKNRLKLLREENASLFAPQRKVFVEWTFVLFSLSLAHLISGIIGSLL